MPRTKKESATSTTPTNISKDHTQFLGETLPQIAAEKAGIIKPNTPVVIGEAIPETRHVFEHKAIETHSKIIFAEDACEVVSVDKSQGGGIFYQTVNYGVVTGALIGEYQIKNTFPSAVEELIKQKNALNSNLKKGD